MDFQNCHIHDRQPSAGAGLKDSSFHPQQHGCHSNGEVQLLLDNLAGFIFGSCASVAEVASNLVPNSWHNNHESGRTTRKNHVSSRPTRLAGLVGKYKSTSIINPKEFAEGIPSFLESENMDYPFEEHPIFDDNISALSAYTLEEMSKKNAHTTMPVSRWTTTTLHPPSVTGTNSSSSSSREHLKSLTTTQGLRGSKTRR